MSVSAYYNEFDPKAAAWLRQLIKNGNITPGEVDERSITEINPDDLIGFDRVHFFAGIGTWDYCLNESGWGDRPIWTASLPCQPFSTAGKGLGNQDERHLLPYFLELVRQCKPDTIFGEQVEGAIKHGWLDDLQTNMEAEGYAIGHCVLGAHSIGAAHIRQRLYWVADNRSAGRKEQPGERRISRKTDGDESRKNIAGGGGMADTEITRAPESKHRKNIGERPTDGTVGSCEVDWMADTFCFKRIKPGNGRGNESIAGAAGRTNSHSSEPESIDWIYCRDNKYRPVKSGISGMGNTSGAASERNTGSILREKAEVSRENRSLDGDSGVGFTDASEDDTCRLGNTEHNGHATDTLPASHVQPGTERRQDGADIPGEFTGTSGRDDATSLFGCEIGRGEWHNTDWLYCRDNKYRPVKSGIKPLVNGIARGMVHSGDPSEQINANETQEARVMRLKGYGNAIQAQTAMAFISAYMSILNG